MRDHFILDTKARQRLVRRPHPCRMSQNPSLYAEKPVTVRRKIRHCTHQNPSLFSGFLAVCQLHLLLLRSGTGERTLNIIGMAPREEMFRRCSVDVQKMFSDVVLPTAPVALPSGESERKAVRPVAPACHIRCFKSEAERANGTRQVPAGVGRETLACAHVPEQTGLSLIPVFLLTRTGPCASRPFRQHGLPLCPGSQSMLPRDRAGQSRP